MLARSRHGTATRPEDGDPDHDGVRRGHAGCGEPASAPGSGDSGGGGDEILRELAIGEFDRPVSERREHRRDHLEGHPSLVHRRERVTRIHADNEGRRVVWPELDRDDGVADPDEGVRGD